MGVMAAVIASQGRSPADAIADMAEQHAPQRARDEGDGEPIRTYLLDPAWFAGAASRSLIGI
jgi:hypothetical protein